LTLLAGIVDLGAPALIAVILPAVTHRHPAAAPAADDKAGQQPGAGTRGAVPLAGEVVQVVPQEAAVHQIGIVAQVSRIDVRHDDVPFIQPDPAVGNGRRVPGDHLAPAPAVDEDAGIGGIGEDLLDHLVSRPHPGERAGFGAGLGQPGQVEAVVQEVALDGAGAAQDGETLEHRGDGMPDGIVGIEHDDTVRPAAEADRQAQGQLAAAGLVQQVAAHPGTQNVQLGGEQRSLDAEKQKIVRIARVIDAVLIGNEGAEQGAQLDNAVPVAVTAGQPGHLCNEDEADLAQADGGHQPLKAGALQAGGAGQAEILIDDQDPRRRPAHPAGLIGELVLPARTLLVALDLLGGGLADIDDGLQALVTGLDLRRDDHEASPPGSGPAAGDAADRSTRRSSDRGSPPGRWSTASGSGRSA
jgi:hypothetical protein